MGENIEIRPYQAGDEEGIVELLRISFPHWAGKENAVAEWLWQYVNSPLKCQVVVALSNNKIIAINENNVVKLKLGASVIKASYGGDVAVHPDFRNLGIYEKTHPYLKKLREEARVNFSYASTTHPAVMKGWKKRKRTPFPHTVDVMVKIGDVELHLKNRPQKNPAIIGFGFIILQWLNNLVNLLAPKVQQTNDFFIVDVARFDGRIDVFWEKIKYSYDFLIERNSTYMNWRYCDSSHEYRIRQAVKDGEILGYIITELRKDDAYTEAYIIDALAFPDRADVSDALFRDACKYFEDLNVNTVYFRVIKGHQYQKISNKYGFILTLKRLFTTCNILEAVEEFEVLKQSSPNRVQYTYSETL